MSLKKMAMDIAPILDKLMQWASTQTDVIAAALVGSYAHDAATKESDLDLMILTTDLSKYFQDKQWVSLFGEVERTEVEHWGRTKTLRAFYRNEIEIEFNFSAPDWASIPVDPGTHRVIYDGMRILFDPQDILKAAQQAVLSEQ